MMIEPELGAMFKRLVSMAEDRCSDYAVGKEVMVLVKTVMASVEQTTPLSAAEKMDRAAEIEEQMESWKPQAPQLGKPVIF